jgi:hypothetical protein
MSDDRDTHRKQLEGFFRDELRAAEAEAPSFDDLAAYVDGRLSPAESADLEQRIAGDEVVRREVELLRELRVEMARTRVAPARRAWVWTGLAAAASVAAVASLVLLKRGAGPSPAPAPSPIALVAAVSDGDRKVMLTEEGGLVGLGEVDADLRAAVASALRGQVAEPAGLAALRPGRSALMGTASGTPVFGPLAPVGLRVSNGRPTFLWSPHPEAVAYDVKVFDQDFREQAAGADIRGTEWQPPRPLAPGVIYLWQVTARTGHGRVSAPVPPRPEARFEVADEALLAQVGRRRSAAPSSHLVAAIAFLEAGLLDDADSELQALAAANPDSARVAALRDRVRSMR